MHRVLEPALAYFHGGPQATGRKIAGLVILLIVVAFILLI